VAVPVPSALGSRGLICPVAQPRRRRSRAAQGSVRAPRTKHEGRRRGNDPCDPCDISCGGDQARRPGGDWTTTALAQGQRRRAAGEGRRGRGSSSSSSSSRQPQAMRGQEGGTHCISFSSVPALTSPRSVRRLSSRVLCVPVCSGTVPTGSRRRTEQSGTTGEANRRSETQRGDDATGAVVGFLRFPSPMLSFMRTRVRRIGVWPLLLFVLLCSSLSLCVVCQTACPDSSYVLSPLDGRFCCPPDDSGLRYRLDVSSINDAGTAANCRSCRTSEATFNDCKAFTGGAHVCCAGQWGQENNEQRMHKHSNHVCAAFLQQAVWARWHVHAGLMSFVCGLALCCSLLLVCL
jgi:hypothetical protein